jgi:hypothetical protein
LNSGSIEFSSYPTMEPLIKRNKKSDKAKKTFDLHGGFTQKHVRAVEALKTKKKTS